MKKIVFAAVLCAVLIPFLCTGCYEYGPPKGGDEETTIPLSFVAINFGQDDIQKALLRVNPTAISQDKRAEWVQLLKVELNMTKATYVYNGAGKWMPLHVPLVFPETGKSMLSLSLGDGSVAAQDGSQKNLVLCDSMTYFTSNLESIRGLEIGGMSHARTLFEIRFDRSAMEVAGGTVKLGDAIAYRLPEGEQNWYQAIMGMPLRETKEDADIVFETTISVGGYSVLLSASDIGALDFNSNVRYIIDITADSGSLKIKSITEAPWLNAVGYVEP